MSDNKKTADLSSMVKTAMFMFATSGFWCPLWWSTRWKRCYKFFSVFMSFVLSLWMVSQIISVTFNIKDVIKLTTNFQSFISGMGSVCKATNILISRQNIVTLLNMLDDDYCKAQDSREISIQRKYEKICRWINISLAMLAVITITCISLSPFFNDSNARVLPFLTWLPYRTDSELTYWCSYIYEIIMVSIVALLCVGNDLLVVMIQISVQFDILNHRLVHMVGPNLTTVSYEQEIRRKFISNVHHHRFIFKLGELTQRCFVATFAFQMFVTLVGSCTSAFLFSRFNFGSPAFNSALLVVTGLITEAFLYCWFANEVYLKSLQVGDAVYNMDWINVDATLRKDLLNIAIRSGRPILFTSGPALALSNDVFVSILKASYTAFTVLQRIGIRSSSISVPAGR